MHYPYPFAFVGRLMNSQYLSRSKLYRWLISHVSYEIKSSNPVTPFGLFASGSSTQDTLSVTLSILSKLTCGQLMSPYCD